MKVEKATSNQGKIRARKRGKESHRMRVINVRFENGKLKKKKVEAVLLAELAEKSFYSFTSAGKMPHQQK